MIITVAGLAPQCPMCGTELRRNNDGSLRCRYNYCLACRDFSEAEVYWWPLSTTWPEWKPPCWQFPEET